MFFVNIIKFLIDLPYFIYLLVSTFLISVLQKLKKRHRKNIDNEIILITGAASGLGQQLVWKLAGISSQAVYVLWDIDDVGLASTADKCRELGAPNIHTYKVDLSKREDVVRTANLVLTQVGTVTLLINNAGMAHFNFFLDSDVTAEELVFKINLLSQMWTIREFLPGMIAKGRGHLVSTCSGLAFHRFPYLSSYVASKYGLRGFLGSLRLEIGMHSGKPNIPISIIYPGWVKTPMTSEITWEPRYDVNVLKHMDPEYVTEKMVEGILNEDEEICIPSLVKHLPWCHRCLPAKFIDLMENCLFRNIVFGKQK